MLTAFVRLASPPIRHPGAREVVVVDEYGETFVVDTYCSTDRGPLVESSDLTGDIESIRERFLDRLCEWASNL